MELLKLRICGILGLVFWLCCACGPSQTLHQGLSLQVQDTLYLDPIQGQSSQVYNLQVYESNQEEFLMFSHYPDPNLVIFTWPEGEFYKRVRPPFSHKGPIWGSWIAHPDSLFVLHNSMATRNPYHDSVLVRLNLDGEVQEVYDWRGTEMLVRENREADEDYLWIPATLNANIAYHNQQLYLPLSVYGDLDGKEEIAANHFPLGGVMKIKDDESFEALPVYFRPEHLREQSSACDTDIPGLFLDLAGHPIQFVSNESVLYRICQEEGQIDTVQIQSEVFDFFAQQSGFSHPCLSFGRLLREREQYLLSFTLPENPLLPAEYQSRSAYLLFDKDWTLLGEGLLPEGVINDVAFSWQGHLYLYHKRLSEKNKKLSLLKCSFEEIEGGDTGHLFKLISRYYSQKKPRLQDLKVRYFRENIGIVEPKARVLMCIAEHSCLPCIQKLVDWYRPEAAALAKKGIYLLFAADDEATLAQFMKNVGWTDEPRLVFLDKQGAYKQHMKSFVNIQEFTLSKDQVETGANFQTADMENWPEIFYRSKGHK